MNKVKSTFIKGKEYLLHPLTFYEPLVQGVFNNLKDDTTGREKDIGKLTGVVRRINIRSFKANYLIKDTVLISRRELSWLIIEYQQEPVVF